MRYLKRVSLTKLVRMFRTPLDQYQMIHQQLNWGSERNELLGGSCEGLNACCMHSLYLNHESMMGVWDWEMHWMLTGSQQVALNGSPLSHHRPSLALALKPSKDSKLKSERVPGYWKWNEQEQESRETRVKREFRDWETESLRLETRVTRERLRVRESFGFFCLAEFWLDLQTFGFNRRIPAVRLKPIIKILINEQLDLERELFNWLRRDTCRTF